jgi:hypothetical protein
MNRTIGRGLRMAAAWMALAAILACGNDDDDDTPPPPPTAVAQPLPTPQPIAQPQAPARPMGPTALSLTPGFQPDPMTARGTAGGFTMANTLNRNCRGRIPDAPQHTVTLQNDFRYLRVLVHSTEDTTLVIRQPDGTYRCEDDSEGLNPIVGGAFGPGEYQIFIGTFTGSQGPYVLGFSELRDTMAAELGY